jgi:hypothetical protein
MREDAELDRATRMTTELPGIAAFLSIALMQVTAVASEYLSVIPIMPLAYYFPLQE